MTNTVSSVDVNMAFDAERAGQLQAVADRQADLDRRVAEGTLVPLGDGRYRINQPGSWDDGEVWTMRDGQVLPQHGLDTTTGQAALYTTTPAWHGLGTVIPGGTADIGQVLKLGRIDFTVTRRPVLFRADLTDPDSPIRTLPDQFVTVREDTGAGLGVVGLLTDLLGT